VVRADQLQEAAEEARDRRDNREPEGPGCRVILETEGTDHHGEQTSQTAEDTDREAERGGELLFPRELVVVAVLQEIEVERLHCSPRLSGM
jgi:hypothetical protein